MKLSLLLTAAISIASISFIPFRSVQATSFNEQQVNQNQFAAIAAPYHHGYNLVLIEQIPGQQKCWSEKGAFPTKVEPLFLNFDFTNACKRSSDSNNYSIRVNGQDYGMDYLVEIVKKNNELHLIGVPRDRTKPQLHIGRTYGLNSGSLKIVLDPQWRLTKRTYKQNVTDHVYLSHDSNQPNGFISHAVQPVAQPAVQTTPQPATNYNYPANVYQQPVYPVSPVPQPPTGNVYQQPVYSVQPAPQPPMGNVYQQPVYSVQPAPQPPMGNAHQQPVYPVQPGNNNYRQY